MCTFKKYENGKIECECKVKLKFNSFLNTDSSRANLIYKFKISGKTTSNLWVLKCYRRIFSKEVIISNYCSIIILLIILFTIIGAIIFWLKEQKKLYNKIKVVISFSSQKWKSNNINNSKKKKGAKYLNNNLNTGNNINNKKRKYLNNLKNFKKNEASSNRDLILNNNLNNNIIRKRLVQNRARPTVFNKFKKTNNNNKTRLYGENKKLMEVTDNELNYLSYEVALVRDKRTFFQFYVSLIRTKQLLVFPFHCKNDFNSRMIKINFLFFIISLIVFLNTAFISENILHDLYEFEGKLSLMYLIPTIGYISLITLAVKNLLMEIIFTEGDIILIKEADPLQKDSIIKGAFTAVTLRCILFYVFSIFIISLICFYEACFFAVFKNTQLFVIKNSIISLGAISLFPIIFSIFPASLRIISLESKERKSRLCVYIFAKILQLIVWTLFIFNIIFFLIN